MLHVEPIFTCFLAIFIPFMKFILKSFTHLFIGLLIIILLLIHGSVSND